MKAIVVPPDSLLFDTFEWLPYRVLDSDHENNHDCDESAPLYEDLAFSTVPLSVNDATIWMSRSRRGLADSGTLYLSLGGELRAGKRSNFCIDFASNSSILDRCFFNFYKPFRAMHYCCINIYVYVYVYGYQFP